METLFIHLWYHWLCGVCADELFMNSLTAGGIRVDVLKHDFIPFTPVPYIVGINLTNASVSVILLTLYCLCRNLAAVVCNFVKQDANSAAVDTATLVSIFILP